MYFPGTTILPLLMISNGVDMEREEERKKEGREQFSFHPFLPAPVPLINFVYNRNEGRGWSRNLCAYTYTHIYTFVGI